MRRPTFHRDRHTPLDVKMTPMIDVIFLLLTFFVCTASFQPPEEILPTRLLLPGATSSQVQVDPMEEDLDEIVVEVLWRENRAQWRINQRPYGQLAEVRAKLTQAAALKADLPVILDVEASVPMEDVIDVYDLCRDVGLLRIQFAASVGV
jgi:biopolymer transport protein ExbD